MSVATCVSYGALRVSACALWPHGYYHVQWNERGVIHGRSKATNQKGIDGRQVDGAGKQGPGQVRFLAAATGCK